MPARLPTRIKTLKGTLRPDRVKLREPTPQVGVPRASRSLSLDVKREFDKLVRHLKPLQVLSPADALGLELCASALAEHWQLLEVLQDKGLTYETQTPAGSTMVRARPEVLLAQDAWRRASAMLREYGLTPAARPRVEVLPEPLQPSKWGGALSGGAVPFEDKRRARSRAG